MMTAPLLHGPMEAKPRAVTPTISAEVISGESTSALYAKRDLAAAREVLERFETFAADTVNSSDLTDDAKALSVYEARKQSAEKATEILAKAGDAAHAHERAAESALNAAARPQRTTLAKEIRQHVKSLSPGERASFLQQAAGSGDVETVDAILGGAPLYLSGLGDLTEDAAQTVRERAMEARAPLEMAALREAREVTRRIVAAWQASMNMRPARNERLETLKARATKRGAFKV